MEQRKTLRGVCCDENATVDVPAIYEDGGMGYEKEKVSNLPGVISIQELSTAVQAMISPVFEQFGVILERTNQAIERIAASNQMMNARISDLEKQMRLKTPLSKSQEKCVNDAIRARARELLDAKGCGDDKKAVTKLGGAIRKAVLSRYGVSSLREAPAYDYDTAMEQIRRWNDYLAVKDVCREARERKEAEDRGQ